MEFIAILKTLIDKVDKEQLDELQKKFAKHTEITNTLKTKIKLIDHGALMHSMELYNLEEILKESEYRLQYNKQLYDLLVQINTQTMKIKFLLQYIDWNKMKGCNEALSEQTKEMNERHKRIYQEITEKLENRSIVADLRAAQEKERNMIKSIEDLKKLKDQKKTRMATKMQAAIQKRNQIIVNILTRQKRINELELKVEENHGKIKSLMKQSPEAGKSQILTSILTNIEAFQMRGNLKVHTDPVEKSVDLNDFNFNSNNEEHELDAQQNVVTKPLNKTTTETFKAPIENLTKNQVEIIPKPHTLPKSSMLTDLVEDSGGFDKFLKTIEMEKIKILTNNIMDTTTAPSTAVSAMESNMPRTDHQEKNAEQYDAAEPANITALESPQKEDTVFKIPAPVAVVDVTIPKDITNEVSSSALESESEQGGKDKVLKEFNEHITNETFTVEAYESMKISTTTDETSNIVNDVENVNSKLTADTCENVASNNNKEQNVDNFELSITPASSSTKPIEPQNYVGLLSSDVSDENFREKSYEKSKEFSAKITTKTKSSRYWLRNSDSSDDMLSDSPKKTCSPKEDDYFDFDDEFDDNTGKRFDDFLDTPKCVGDNVNKKNDDFL